MSTIPISKKCEMESQDSVVLSSCGEDESILLESVEETVENEGSDVDQGEYFLVSTVHEVAEEGDIKIFSEEISLDDNLSISDICRICANVNDHLIPIFKGEGLEHDLYNKIHKHLPIKVSEEDTLPLQLCYHCAATLLAWNDLSEGCLEAQSKLLQLQKQAEKRNSSTWQVEFTAEKIEENPPENVNFHETETLEQVQQEHDYLKSDEANDEVSNSERSSRAQTSFKVFLATQNMFRRPQSKRKIKVDSDLVWIETTQPTPIHEHQQASINLNDEELKQDEDFDEEKHHYEDFQMNSEVSDNDNEELNWKCTTCDCEFNAASELNEHAKLHNSSESYKCHECGKCFKLKDSYLRHTRIHKDERPFTCHVCGKQFRDSGGLSRHLKDVHAKLKKFACDLCGSCFASKATRDDHRRTHTGERPYICDCCGKAFKSKASLYIHSKLHTDEFPHPCSYCTKKFRRKQEMLAHITTHTGEKNYVCDVCTKRFRVKSELVRHRLVHSNEKPFVCTTCGFAFRQKRYLNNHLKTRHVDSLRNS